jgi:hypothetical protein
MHGARARAHTHTHHHTPPLSEHPKHATYNNDLNTTRRLVCWNVARCLNSDKHISFLSSHLRSIPLLFICQLNITNFHQQCVPKCLYQNYKRKTCSYIHTNTVKDNVTEIDCGECLVSDMLRFRWRFSISRWGDVLRYMAVGGLPKRNAIKIEVSCQWIS